MATVERRRRSTSDGTPGEIRYRVRWRDPAGRQRSKSFKRRRDANAWATEVEHQVMASTYIDQAAGRITLKSYAESWRAARVWAPSTGERVESVFRRHIYPTLGDQPIGSISPSHVQAWVAGLNRTLAPSTVGVVSANLSSVMKAAVKDRIIPSNPCADVDLPRVPESEVVPPTPDQVEQLLGAVAPEWRAVLVALAGLGLRVSEALGLTLSRVDFLRRTVRIDQQVAIKVGVGVVLVPTLKTKASSRTVPLPDSIGRELARHLEVYPASKDGAIFHNGGQLIRRQRVTDAIASAVAKVNKADEKAKRPPSFPDPVRAHDLRHFYASMLIASGVSVKTVQKRLGHASAVETLDTYGHLWPDSEEQTREAVENVLGDRVARTWPASSI